jgi:2-oxoglutarate dehydrogenase E1 component
VHPLGREQSGQEEERGWWLLFFSSVEGRGRASFFLSAFFFAAETTRPLSRGIDRSSPTTSAPPNHPTKNPQPKPPSQQVAFTTDPKKSRSSPYCTDVAKALNAPIFHVNADDVESVVRVCTLAAEWRQRWKSDVVVDLVCYRKHGHNEIDEPMFTQPLMYRRIRAHKNAHQQYIERLLSEGSVDAAAVRETHDRVQTKLSEAFEASRDYKPRAKDWLASHWEGFMSPAQMSRIRNTGVKHDLLLSVGKAITALPDTLTPHRQIKKVYEQRRAMVETGDGVDWATAEALAFATLLVEGNHVRLSGQDVERGTFSHRHAVVHDQVRGRVRESCTVFSRSSRGDGECARAQPADASSSAKTHNPP